jgi:pyruvate formate lyase activating enzyme
MEEPISSPDPSEALAFLKKRQGLLDGVVLSGGEPSLQDLGELRAFLGALKKMGYPVKLDTNGSRPEVIEALLKELLVDYLAVDVKAPPGRYPSSLAEPAEAAGVEETIALALDFQRRGKIRCEFRTTCFSPVIDETAVMLIASSLKGSATLYLQEVRPETVLSPGLVEKAGPQPSKALLRLWAAKASAHLPCVAR